VFANNERAIRLYESLGFEREGVKRKDVFRRGRLEDTLIMGRLR
jgi:putative acetyltransferase